MKLRDLVPVETDWYSSNSCQDRRRCTSIDNYFSHIRRFARFCQSPLSPSSPNHWFWNREIEINSIDDIKLLINQNQHTFYNKILIIYNSICHIRNNYHLKISFWYVHSDGNLVYNRFPTNSRGKYKILLIDNDTYNSLRDLSDSELVDAISTLIDQTRYVSFTPSHVTESLRRNNTVRNTRNTRNTRTSTSANVVRINTALETEYLNRIEDTENIEDLINLIRSSNLTNDNIETLMEMVVGLRQELAG